MCFPMRVDWEAAGGRPPVVVEYPAPEVASPDGREPDAGWPSPVEKLARDGCALGWCVRRQWARGCLPHAATGAPGASQDSYAVRFALREPDGSLWGAWAVYRAGAWKFVWMWGTALLPFGLAGVTDLKVFLAGPALCDQAFFDRIRVRVAQQELTRKAAAVARPRKGSGEAL
jgi:hypothetical protein